MDCPSLLLPETSKYNKNYQKVLIYEENTVQ